MDVAITYIQWPILDDPTGMYVYLIRIFADDEEKAQHTVELNKAVCLKSFELYCHRRHYHRTCREVHARCYAPLLKYERKTQIWELGATKTCLDAAEKAIRSAVRQPKKKETATFQAQFLTMWEVELQTLRSTHSHAVQPISGETYPYKNDAPVSSQGTNGSTLPGVHAPAACSRVIDIETLAVCGGLDGAVASCNFSGTAPSGIDASIL